MICIQVRWVFLYPTCQVTVVRFYMILLDVAPSSFSFRLPVGPQLPAHDRRSQLALPDLNRQLLIAVGIAGPRPNWQLTIAVGTAGPQPATSRSHWEAPGLKEQIECQNICQIECQKVCQKECQVDRRIECQNTCQI